MGRTVETKTTCTPTREQKSQESVLSAIVVEAGHLDNGMSYAIVNARNGKPIGEMMLVSRIGEFVIKDVEDAEIFLANRVPEGLAISAYSYSDVLRGKVEGILSINQQKIPKHRAFNIEGEFTGIRNFR